MIATFLNIPLHFATMSEWRGFAELKENLAKKKRCNSFSELHRFLSGAYSLRADLGAGVRDGGGSIAFVHTVVVVRIEDVVIVIGIDNAVAIAIGVKDVAVVVAVVVSAAVVADVAVVPAVNITVAAACETGAQKRKDKYKSSELFHAFYLQKSICRISFAERLKYIRVENTFGG